MHARGLAAGYVGEIVLHDVELSVRAGDWLGLLGANGSGKSTLLRALTGQIPLAPGEVSIGGIDLRAHPERAKMVFGYAVDAAELPDGLTGANFWAWSPPSAVARQPPGHTRTCPPLSRWRPGSTTRSRHAR